MSLLLLLQAMFSATASFNIKCACMAGCCFFSFVKYLMSYLGSETHLASKLAVQPVTRHSAPFCFLKNWELPSEFIAKARFGVLQYVVIKPLAAILIFTTESKGFYCYGDINWRCSYIYITSVSNCSQIWALYILVLFYRATNMHLQPIRPLHKFICVKAVVFFTWWQSVAIAIFIEWGVLTETVTYSTDDVGAGVQNFCICIEMFFFALLHRAAFSHTDYGEYEGAALSEQRSLLGNVIDSLKPDDIMQDMKGVVAEAGGNKKVGLDHLLMSQWQQQLQEEEEAAAANEEQRRQHSVAMEANS